MGHVRADEKLREVGNLDGIHLTLGPSGHATYDGSGWDSAFGVEAGLYRVTEGQSLAALGLRAGGAWFSTREGGRAWLQTEIGTTVFGYALGFSAGPTAELDDIDPPRFGAQGSLWLFAGVLPFVRIGGVQRQGAFLELGIRVALPTVRW